jgi:hypothetical protein
MGYALSRSFYDDLPRLLMDCLKRNGPSKAVAAGWLAGKEYRHPSHGNAERMSIGLEYSLNTQTAPPWNQVAPGANPTLASLRKAF